MMGAGTLGVPRRHWDMSFADAAMVHEFPAAAYMMMGLAGITGTIGAIGGAIFILNMVGLGAGSFVVGFLNDQLSGRFGAEAIRYSLLGVALVGGFASLFFLQASRTLCADLRARDD